MSNKPNAAITGTLLFNRRGGGARLIGGDDKLIAWVQETSTALPGDTVECKRIGGDRARVTRVITRAHNTFVGTFQRVKGNAFLIPDDPRIPFNFLIRTGGPSLQRPPRAGDKIVLKMEPWTNINVSPAGQIVELLGAATDNGVDMLSVIRAYNLDIEFPAAVVREAESFPDKIPAAEIAKREDCRNQFVTTIDPDDAKDHDDAICVEKTRDGWRLSVHIADVAHYVRPGTALDREARKRGNSTYLADRCIPMLPLRLSADLCSLRAGVERLAHTAFIEFTSAGKIKRVRFAKTVICVHSRLTYKQAMALLRGEKVQGFVPEVAEAVRTAWQLASMLRKHRFAAGSLDLDFPEVKVFLDADGRADRIERIESDESHQLIEEFMLAANEAVAHAIKNRPAPCIYRIHEKPDPTRLEEFRQFAAVQGLRVSDLKQRKEVQRMLAALRGRPDEHRIKIEFLKSLRRATYSPDAVGHYGLSKADYLHFTSPIRRYADLVAHRVLAGERSGGRKEFADISEHLSTTERNSSDAERDSVRLKKMEYFQRQLDARDPRTFRAIITDTKPHGLLIEIPEVDTVGFIPVSLLPNGPYALDSARSRLVNRRTNFAYKTSDILQVHVCRVDAEQREIEFTLSEKPAAQIRTPKSPIRN